MRSFTEEVRERMGSGSEVRDQEGPTKQRGPSSRVNEGENKGTYPGRG